MRELLAVKAERLVCARWRSVAEDHGEECFVVGVLLSGRGARRPISCSCLSDDDTFDIEGDSGSGTQLLSVLFRGSITRSSAEACLSYWYVKRKGTVNARLAPAEKPDNAI